MEETPGGINEIFNQRTDLSELSETVEQIKAEVGKIIVGQHKMVDLLIAALLADGHVLIEGVPGVAKTLTAKILARILAIQFSRIQFTPDLMPSDVLGTSVFNLKTSDFEFRRGPIFANLVLIDEINRAPAKTQAALFEVMEERQISIDGLYFKMAPPFIVLATQNPIEQEGTYRLPEAQLDRFLFKIEVGYPALDEEAKILEDYHLRGHQNDLQQITPLLSAEQVARFRGIAHKIHIEPNLLRYIAQIVHQTRQDPFIYLGASPRASIAIMAGAKAYAAIRGRDFITPEDVREIAPHVLRHRIVLTAEKEMEGTETDEVLRQLIDRIEVPR
ncbi:MAG: MoxR family ATPase [Bernardetiaceae bacterium]|jgi:MoxR-like ATPase|nr:MoxR family ATPase [Bernardetiaceae bacterium]